MFLLGLILGIALGYLFKPQIDKLIAYIKSVLKENKDNNKSKEE